MRNIPRVADWHQLNREADNTLVVIDRPAAGDGNRHYLTSLNASFDSTGLAEVNVAGLSSVNSESNDGVYALDLTDTGVLDLTGDVFTVAGHGFANGDKVLLNMNGGTAPTGLVANTAYWIVSVSGDDFALAATKGGSAINMSGTQASFGTSADIMRVGLSFFVYDHFEMEYTCPLEGAPNRDLIVTLGAVASVQGLLNVSGYDR